MKIARTENTKRNIITGLLNKVVSLLLPFIVRTILIRKLGAEYLGLNSLFSSILQVLNLADLGFASAIVYSLYKPIAEDQTDEVCAILNYFRKVYKVIGIVIFILGILIIPFLPSLISGNPPKDINITILYLIYLVNTCLTYLLFAYKQALPTAMQRIDIVTNVNTITTGLLNILQIFILLIYPNYYVFLIVMPLCTFINNIILNIFVDKHYPQYKAKGSISKKLAQNIRYNVSGLMIGKVCGVSRNTFDSIFISMFLGLTATAIYNNYFYIINAITGIIVIATQSMLGGVGNSIVVETPEKNYQDMRKLNFLYMWISGWCSVSLLCLFQPFMKIWMGDNMLFPFSSVVLLVLYFYFLKMGDIRSMYVDGTGIWWKNRWRAIAETLVNLILNFLLVQIWGINGIIIATLISILVINFGFGSQIIFNEYFKNGKLHNYFLEHLLYFSITVVICVTTFNLCNLINGSGIIAFLIKSIFCLIVPNLLYFLIYFKTNIFKATFKWLLPKIKKK